MRSRARRVRPQAGERAIIRWRAAKLPKGPDAERAQEELEGMIFDSGTAERFQLAISILLRPARLQREIRLRQQVRNGKSPRDFTAAAFSRAIMRHPNLLDWVAAEITRPNVDEKRRRDIISKKQTVQFGLAMAKAAIDQLRGRRTIDEVCDEAFQMILGRIEAREKAQLK